MLEAFHVTYYPPRNSVYKLMFSEEFENVDLKIVSFMCHKTVQVCTILISIV
jgi:hypothetical protein